MNILSDSESSDSDTGRRFKTASTRTRDIFASKGECRGDDRNGNDRNDGWKNNQAANRGARDDADGRLNRRSRSREYHREREVMRRKERSLSRGRERASSRSRYLDRRRSSRDGDRDAEHRNRDHSHPPRSRGGSRSRRDEKSNSRRNSPVAAYDDRMRKSRESREKRRRSNSREQGSVRNDSADGKSTSTEHDKIRRERQKGELVDMKTSSTQHHSSRSNRVRSISRERKADRYAVVKNALPAPVETAQLLRTEEKIRMKKSKHKKHKHKSRQSSEKDTISMRNDKNLRRSFSIEIDHESIVSDAEETAAETQSNEFEVIDDLMCGPSLPPHMLNKHGVQSSDASPVNEVETTGPRLPLSSRTTKIDRIESVTASTSVAATVKPVMQGPILPIDIDLNAVAAEYKPIIDSAVSDISDSDDDPDLIGPMPIGGGKTKAHLELEKRALELKLAKLNERDERANKETMREEWMIELPEIRGVAGLGLVARQFRAKERDEIGDRSGWTDTPNDRVRKSYAREPTADELRAAQQRDADAVFKAKRDVEQEAAARKHKKKHKRDESLLEIHQKKLKKKKEKDAEKVERRPFSRDNDLKVNRFDEAQKRSVIKKAQLLDTRFGSGQSKYL